MSTVSEQGVNPFLEAIVGCADREEVARSIEVLRHTTDYRCPAPSVLATHLVLDLFSEGSSVEANVNRITTNLEAAADELLQISKLIHRLAD